MTTRDKRPAAMLTIEERAQLLDQARTMATATFERPRRAHVLGVFERLTWNYVRGLGDAGAVTLH